MARLRGSPAMLPEISASGGRARPRAPPPRKWQDRAALEGLRQYEIWPWPSVLRRHGTRTIGGATAAWERCRRDVGSPPPNTWRLPTEHRGLDQDIRSAIGAGGSECALIQKR